MWFILVVVLLLVIFFISLWTKKSWAVDAAATIGLPGSGEASQNVRVVIERLGKFHSVVGPGPFWFFPFLYRVVRDIRITNDSVSLYTDEKHPAKKDLADGSVTAVGAEIVFRIYSPDTPYDAGDGILQTGVERAVYQTGDHKKELENLVDPALSGYITSLKSVDDLLAFSRFEFWESGRIADSTENPVRSRIEAAAWRVGVEILRVQVQHFEQSEEARKAREEVNRHKREMAAAEFVASKTSQEAIGAFIAMCADGTGRSKAEVQNEIKNNEELKKQLQELAREVVINPPEKRNIYDINLQGGLGAIIGELTDLLNRRRKDV